MLNNIKNVNYIILSNFILSKLVLLGPILYNTPNIASNSLVHECAELIKCILAYLLSSYYIIFYYLAFIFRFKFDILVCNFL